MQRKRVLVADDNALIRKMLCHMFADHAKLEICDEAVNGQEAVAMARKYKPHLIILDLSMPIMSGIEAAEAICKFLPNVPIILFSQHAESVIKTIRENLPCITRIVSKDRADTLVRHAEELAV